jgi:hypothetical protein
MIDDLGEPTLAAWETARVSAHRSAIIDYRSSIRSSL